MAENGESPDRAILGALASDPLALGVLYERHAAAVYRFLARRTGANAAEDLLSEVFVAAAAARARVVPHSSGSALPWLYGIAINVVRHHFRRRRIQHAHAGDSGVDWEAVDARLDAQSRTAELRAALSALSEDERQVLLLVAWEGLPPAEVAQALGVSQTAARTRLLRARRRAQRALDRITTTPELRQLPTLLQPQENQT